MRVVASIGFLLHLSLAWLPSCGGASSSKSSPDLTASAPSVVDGGGLPLYSACTNPSDCQSGQCFEYPGRGGYFCTQDCKNPGDCPAPAVGCNGKGKCKLP